MELDTNKIDFKKLVSAIQQVHNQLFDQACRAVNTSLTLRNWLIGLYIREYEQHGTDRAQYGESLLDRLSEELRRIGIPRSDTRELRRYRLFYSVYPQIREALTPESGSRLLLSKDSGVSDSQMSCASQISGKTLISRLSFTHLVELIKLEDATKRLFYEMECIRGNWSVRELKRQIGSLYYERSGLSYNKNSLNWHNKAQRKTSLSWPSAILTFSSFLDSGPKKL